MYIESKFMYYSHRHMEKVMVVEQEGKYYCVNSEAFHSFFPLSLLSLSLLWNGTAVYKASCHFIKICLFCTVGKVT